MSNTFEIGRPLSPSTTVPIFREVEVNIPEIDSVVDDGYVGDCIVDEHDFQSPSLHDENYFVLSHLNVCSPCTEHESEPVIDIVSISEIDSCSEGISEVQPLTLGLGVIPLHVISLEPHCTNHVAGGTYGFDEHTPMVEDKGASIHDSLKINRHQLNLLINNHCFLDPVVEDISLLDQIWRMKQFLLKTSLLNPVVEEISLKVQNWQLPP